MRGITRAEWQSVLDEAKCTILGVLRDEACNAYLLSESSLFVYSHKIVAKTCGTTTLLRMLPPLLRLVMARGMQVEWVAYSRKDFLFPQEQKFPHRSTAEEVRLQSLQALEWLSCMCICFVLRNCLEALAMPMLSMSSGRMDPVEGCALAIVKQQH